MLDFCAEHGIVADIEMIRAEQIDAAFVRVGFEIEDVEPFGDVEGPFVVGRVESIEELTDFKKPIRFCLGAVGKDGPEWGGGAESMSAKLAEE